MDCPPLCTSCKCIKSAGDIVKNSFRFFFFFDNLCVTPQTCHHGLADRKQYQEKEKKRNKASNKNVFGLAFKVLSWSDLDSEA